MTNESYSVRILEFARADVRGPEVFRMSRWDEWVTLGFSAVLLQGRHRQVLINTGMSEPNAELDDLWEDYCGHRRARMRHGNSVIAQLDELGVSTADVTDIIVSPFQAYALADIGRYENARIHMLRSGWAQYQAPADSYLLEVAQARPTSVSREVMAYLLFEAWDRIHFLDDEDIVAPGICTVAVGVHHAESLAVDICTTRGRAIWTDGIFTLENFENRIALGVTRSLTESSQLQRLLEKSEAIVIPALDANFNASLPEGLVAEPSDGP